MALSKDRYEGCSAEDELSEALADIGTTMETGRQAGVRRREAGGGGRMGGGGG